MTFFENLFLIMIIMVIIFIIICCFIFKYRKRYTRERFAFFATSTIFTLFITMIVPMFKSESLITFFINIINQIFNFNLPTPEKDIWGQTLVVLIFLSILVFIRNIHRDWESKNGAISIRHDENKRFSRPSGLLNDSISRVIYVFKEPEKLKTFIPIEDKGVINIFEHVNEKEQAWHVQVADLLLLISNQYKINIENDWYSESSTFISNYGKNNELIGIYCTIKEPTEIEIKKFINFIKTYKGKFYKLIIAVKQGKKEKKEIYIDDYIAEFRYESEMLSNLVDFSNYFESIKKQFEVDEISQGCGFSLNDVYTGVGYKLKNNVIDTDKGIEKYIYEWLESNTERKHLAILGEYGQGKSVLTLKISYQLLKDKTKYNRIPILLVLRGKSPRNLSILELVSNWASNYNINPKAILKLHTAGRLLLIFEGFDEMDLVGDKETRLNHFQRLWEFATPYSKIIITGRPNFFLDTEELEIALGTKQQIKGGPYCEAIYLKQFSEIQIEKALRKTKKKISKEILALIKGSQKNDTFFDLVARPSTLFQVSQIWEARNLSQKKEQINSALITQEFIQYNYARQQAKNERTKYALLNVNEREYFMIGIAVGMVLLNRYSNQISKNELQNSIKKLYNNFPDDISRLQTAFDEKKRISLKERIETLSFLEESVMTDVRTCGILVNDLSRSDHFKFAHKSFLEFLVRNEAKINSPNHISI